MADTTDTNILGMSDEELLNMAPPSDDEVPAEEPQEPAAEPEEEPVEDNAEEDVDDPQEDDDSSDDDNDEDEIDSEEPTDEDDVEGEEPAAEDDKEGDEEESDDEEEEAKAEGDDAEEEASEEPDYKSFYEQITAPFRANDREIKIDNVQDAIRLMQMGVNYNSKMAGLKPHRKILKMLEGNDLLSEDKLSFLIDLDKRNPDAITKLIKDSGIDPLDVNLEAAEAYEQTNHAPSDSEVVLDEVLESIQDSPSYQRTITEISDVWDERSRTALVQEPQVIAVINGHMDNGVYDVIANEVTKQKALGQLTGLSDIEAYKQVGDQIQARGGFDHLFQETEAAAPATPEPVTPTPAPATVKVKPAASRVEDPKTVKRKKAAGGTRPSGKGNKGTQFDPLSLSDEEFEKMSQSDFLTRT